jgi:murein DD-endopeptidase MepM/ murein hydrolase activator NlpD
MRRPLRGLLLGALLSSLAATAFAAIQKPRNCRAIPDYGAGNIIVEWDDVNNDVGYRVFRAPQPSGPFEQISPDLPTDTTIYIDPGPDFSAEHFYQVRAFDQSGESAPSNIFQQNLKVLWPNPGNLALLHNWNETIGTAGHQGLGYHRGCDLQQTGSSQNELVAPRGGIVVRTGSQASDNNHVFIEVKIGGLLRYDSFNHLDGSGVGALAVQLGDYVRAGQVIGKIGDDYFTGGTVDFVDHTHFNIVLDPFVTTVDGQHPLKIFSADSERDPWEVRPGLFDHAELEDGVVLFHRQSAAPGPPYLELPLGDQPGTPEDEGNVDLHVEIADDLNGGAGTTHVPTGVAWWIEGRECDSGPPVVRSEQSPYRLFRWDHRFFLDEGVDWQLLVDESQNLAATISHDGVSYPSTWSNFKHFIVTNTSGTDGEGQHVDGTQYWNTNALDDGTPATVDHANFAALPDAGRAQDARFADGDYTLHLILSDLLGDREEQVPGIRLENFPPAIASVCATEGDAAEEALEIAFSEPMDRPSVEASIAVDPLEEAPAVSFTPFWSAGGCVLRLVPDSLPDPSATYRIELSGGTARDLQARLLDSAFGDPQHNGVSEGAPDSVSTVFAFAPLADVQGVALAALGSGASRMLWTETAGAESYAVTRGNLSSLSLGLYGSCLATGRTTSSLDDLEVPDVGRGFVYLVQGENAPCGKVGPLGLDSSGSERHNTDPNACHTDGP